MLLSNPAKYFLICTIISLIGNGCGFWQDNNKAAAPLVSEPKSNIPFPTKEPDVFQGEFVTSNGESFTSSFYAKKGDKWRFDVASGAENSTSILKTDKMYSISHKKRTFAEMPSGQYPSTDPEFVNDFTYGLLKVTEYARFEEAGREGNVIKYRARIGDSDSSEALIYFDESAGMVVKEEFTSRKDRVDAGSRPDYIFEIRNLKLEVDDSVFNIPEGYRKVSWDEYSPPSRRK